jgi:hypothetical protein
MTDPLDVERWITVFPNLEARSRESCNTTLRKFSDKLRNTTALVKTDLALYSGCRFGERRTSKNALRSDRNVLECVWVIGEYDAGRTPMRAAVDAIAAANLCALVATTFSYRPEAPRYRIIAPLAEILLRNMPNRLGLTLDDYGMLVSRLAGVMPDGLAVESWTLSQGWYLGGRAGNADHGSILIGGDCLDLRLDLDAGARAKPSGRKRTGAPASEADSDDTELSNLPASLDLAELLDAIRRGQGSHRALVSAAGKLASQGVHQTTAIAVLRSAANGRPEADRDDGWHKMVGDIRRTVEFAYEKFAEQEAELGAGFLIPVERPGQGGGTTSPPPPGPPPPPPGGSAGPPPASGPAPMPRGAAGIIDWLNDRYFVVNEAGRVVVYAPSYDTILQRGYFERISFADFEKLYCNQTVAVAGRRRKRSIAELWLKHPARKQYIGGVTFDPANRAPRPDVLNLWQGFAVTPAQGSWKQLYRHTEEIICGSDHVLFAYLLDWLADLVQHPGRQSEVTVVLRGDEGCGKGILARAICRLLGQHGMHITNARHLVGSFNAHLRDLVFLFADEAFYAGDKQHTGVLLTLISEPTLIIEGKYRNAIQTPNFLHIMMASNKDWVVPASLRSRRWVMADVLPDRIGDHDYFTAIQKELENGGFSALLYDLLHRDISRSNLRAVPVTAVLEDQRKRSLDTITAWWFDCLYRGYVFVSQLGFEDHFQQWHEWLATDLLYASYTGYCTQRRDWHPETRENFGKWLTSKAGAKPARKRDGVVGEHMVDATMSFGHTSRIAELVKLDLARGYNLGTLEQVRVSFEKTTGLQPDWDDQPVSGAPGGGSWP